MTPLRWLLSKTWMRLEMGLAFLASALLSVFGVLLVLTAVLLLALLSTQEPLSFDLWLTQLDRQLVNLYALWLGQPSLYAHGLPEFLQPLVMVSQYLPAWACVLSTGGSHLASLAPLTCAYLIQVLLWGSLLVTAVMLCFLSLRLRLLSSLLVVSMLLSMQVQAYQLGWFLPVSAQLLGFLLMLAMLSQARGRRATMNELAATVRRQRLELLQLHIAARDDSSAFAVLRAPVAGRLSRVEREQHCQTLFLWAEDLLARARQDLAVEVFQQVRQLHRRYRGVEEKLQTLSAQSDAAGRVAQVKPLDVTVALADTVPLISSPTQHKSVALPQELGRYRVERELGRGASGIVYLGHDPRIGRQVAIKTMSFHDIDAASLPALRERFAREAEAAGRLRHPSIVTVFDVGETSDCAFIAMEYIDGRPLSECVQSAALLPVATVYHIVAQVADALHYAHGANIIHRDVKPGNILWDEHTQQASVSDFGIARISDQSRTRTGEIMGSPLYMAPEQLKGSAVGPAADIFSLGVTFYQLLTGQAPFEGDNLANLSYQIMHGKHQPVRKLRPELIASATRIINRALQKDPRERYANAGEMAEALRSSLRRDFKVKV